MLAVKKKRKVAPVAANGAAMAPVAVNAAVNRLPLSEHLVLVTNQCIAQCVTTVSQTSDTNLDITTIPKSNRCRKVGFGMNERIQVVFVLKIFMQGHR